MPLAQIIARLPMHRIDSRAERAERQRRALLLDNLRTAEEAALLARRFRDRAGAFLNIARGAYEAALTY